MDPNNKINTQPATPPTQTGGNPYEFIMQPSQSKSNKPGIFKSKAVVILGIGLLLTLLAVIIPPLFRGGGGNAESLISLVAEQQEIARLSDIGIKEAETADTRGYAQTIKLSVVSQQNSLKSYLTERNVKIEPVQLGAFKDAQAESSLNTAAKANQFDPKFEEVIKSKLLAYGQNLQKNYQNASNNVSKNLLSDSFVSTKELLK